MNLVQSTRHLLTIFGLDNGRETAVVTLSAPPTWQPAGELAQQQPAPVIIPGYVPTAWLDQRLSTFLRIGRLYHPLCRNTFIERVQIGYYAYERREPARRLRHRRGVGAQPWRPLWQCSGGNGQAGG